MRLRITTDAVSICCAPRFSRRWTRTVDTFSQSARPLRAAQRDVRSTIVIFDMHPILVGDDAISILPRMDAVLLIAAVGNTSIADIRESQKHLKVTPVVRVVINKVTDKTDSYYGF